MRLVALTTVDNPYSPIDEFPQWFSFDNRHGYGTASLLARVAITSDELSEVDKRVALEEAIDEIVIENVSGFHRKFVKEVSESANS